MIKFFRHLRQKLLSDNKLGKYLIYAFGEIILVVIGILIALEVNNRNEAQKEVQLEIIMLENIKRDLNLDTLDISFNLSFHQVFIKAEKQLLNFLLSNRNIPEVPIDYTAALGMPMLIALHESTFANLQNNNIGILSNNELRKDIARYYDFFNDAIKMIENDAEDLNTYTIKLPYFMKYFKIDPKAPPLQLNMPDSKDYYSTDLQKLGILLDKTNEAKKDEGFKILLNESIAFRQATIDMYILMLNRIDELNLAIDKELEILRR